MPKTLREQFRSALEAKGEKFVQHLSRCDVLTRTKTLSGRPIPYTSFWYIGVNGSLRYGKTRGESYAVPEDIKRRFLAGETLRTLESQGLILAVTSL